MLQPPIPSTALISSGVQGVTVLLMGAVFGGACWDNRDSVRAFWTNGESGRRAVLKDSQAPALCVRTTV